MLAVKNMFLPPVQQLQDQRKKWKRKKKKVREFMQKNVKENIKGPLTLAVFFIDFDRLPDQQLLKPSIPLSFGNVR